MTVDVAAVNCVHAHCTNVLYIFHHTPYDGTDERVGVFVLADLSARSSRKLFISRGEKEQLDQTTQTNILFYFENNLTEERACSTL